MATSSQQQPLQAATTPFADLRRSKERAIRVAQMLAARRSRQVEQAIRAQRQQRIHQAR